MPFIRVKRAVSCGYYWDYHYLVESYREQGKVKQRTLLYLGHAKTVEEALRTAEVDAKRAESTLDYLERKFGSRPFAAAGKSDRLRHNQARRKLASLDRRIEACKRYLASARTEEAPHE